MNYKLPLVSIVMLSWNRKDDVKNGIIKTFESSYKNIEMIVVDNNSEDDTSTMVLNEFPNVNLIRLSRNIGIEGFNIGFANAKGKYIVILDDDSYPEKSAIELAVNILETRGEIGIIAANVIDLRTNEPRWEKFKEYAEKKTTRFVGCGAVLRKETLDIVGYYDYRFFLYANELDLSIRFLQINKQVVYFNHILFYHKFAEKNRLSKNFIKFGARNNIWIIWKYYPYPIEKIIKFIINHTKHNFKWPNIIYSLSGIWEGLYSLPRIKRRFKVFNNLQLQGLFYYSSFKYWVYKILRLN